VNRSLKTVHAPAVGDAHEWRQQVSLRDASYLTAVERVAHACHERGWV
jgi:glutamate dehydrogenase/leucine dehydrogenase